jgi:hypothetical protein
VLTKNYNYEKDSTERNLWHTVYLIHPLPSIDLHSMPLILEAGNRITCEFLDRAGNRMDIETHGFDNNQIAANPYFVDKSGDSHGLRRVECSISVPGVHRKPGAENIQSFGASASIYTSKLSLVFRSSTDTITFIDGSESERHYGRLTSVCRLPEWSQYFAEILGDCLRVFSQDVAGDFVMHEMKARYQESPVVEETRLFLSDSDEEPFTKQDCFHWSSRRSK